LLFADTFNRISSQLAAIEELLGRVNADWSNHWVVYNFVLSVIPIAEHIIFAGYSDQILQFVVSVNSLRCPSHVNTGDREHGRTDDWSSLLGPAE
jgi:hypothetical protein